MNLIALFQLTVIYKMILCLVSIWMLCLLGREVQRPILALVCPHLV